MRNAQWLESRKLAEAGFRHAFFTRHHGWSTGAYASLNFSSIVGDDEAAVRRNFELGAAALGISPARLCFAKQVHGRVIVTLEATSTAESVASAEADGVISSVPGLACAVRTADCLPILIGELGTGIVAAVHAGWRGVEANIVAAAVDEMREIVGGPGEFVAAIGPHIGLASFEVSPDVAERLESASPVDGVVDRRGPKPHVDLARIVVSQLCREGLSPHDIDRVGGCTVLEADSYFSFRRDGPRSGRHLHAIVPRGPLSR